MDYGKERYHVFYRIGDERAIVSVPFTGEFEAARCDAVTLVRGIELSDEGFNHEIE